MRLLSVHLSGYRNLAVDLLWADAIVLFGPNDAGKTNVLEALDSALTGDEPARAELRQDWWSTDEAVEAEIEFELDGLAIRGHPERFLIQQMLLYDDPQFLFESHRSIAAARRDGSRTRFNPTVGEDEHVLRIRGDSTSSFADVIQSLVDELVAFILRPCTNAPMVVDDCRTLVRACTASRWFKVTWEGVWWLTPSAESCSSDVLAAARRVGEQSELWLSKEIPVIGAFVQILDLGANLREPFMLVGSEMLDFRPLEVVRIFSAARDLDAVSQAVEAFVVETVEKARGRITDIQRPRGALSTSGFIRFHDEWPDRDPWLEEVPGGAFRVHSSVDEACARLGALATKIAPAFVRSRYEIVIEAVPPDEWSDGEGRIRLAVRAERSGERFNMSTASAGIATWCGYALEEAVRQSREAGGHQRESVVEVPTATEGLTWGQVSLFFEHFKRERTPMVIELTPSDDDGYSAVVKVARRDDADVDESEQNHVSLTAEESPPEFSGRLAIPIPTLYSSTSLKSTFTRWRKRKRRAGLQS